MNSIGRRLSFMIICLALGVSMTVTSFATNFWTFSALRLITGIGGAGQFIIIYVWGKILSQIKLMIPYPCSSSQSNNLNFLFSRDPYS